MDDKLRSDFRSIHQRSTNVFYVYAPPWRDSSAGIRVLHYLCHSLNVIGCPAWLVLTNPNSKNQVVNHGLKTPLLSEALARQHIQSGQSPIVVYSETILGNPLKAKRVIRWILNFPGALGGSSHFPGHEFIVSYSENIKNRTSNCNNVLFLPAVDLDELPQSLEKQKGLALVYAGKYRSFIGSPPQLPENPIEIFRDGKKKLSRIEFLAQIAKAERIYLFENSTVATEAVLMNTIAIFVPNIFLGEIIAEFELGLGGVAVGFEPSQIAVAKQTIPNARLQYNQAQENFWDQLYKLIVDVGEYFQDQPPQDIPVLPPTTFIGLFKHRIRLTRGIIQQKGMATAVRTIFIYFTSARRS